MREMKDSGIEWIGEIPVQWNLVQTKRFFTNTKKIVGAKADNYDRLALTLNGVIKRSKDDSEGLQPEKFEGYQILCKNELVFKLIDLENVKTSRVGLSPYTGLVSPAYIVLSNDLEDNRFFYYWFMFMYYNEVFNHLGGEGVRSALNAKDVLSLPVPDIESDKQRRIADYLDRKCSQIDDIIARQQEVIEKLKAYKLSVITEAVTKGLNPDVPMKDSGVEWIGEIPEHWEIRRIGSFARVTSSKRIFEESYVDEGVPFYRSKEITDLSKGLHVQTEIFIPEEVFEQVNEASPAPKCGDILLTSIGTIGNTWISDGRKFYYKDGNITQIEANDSFDSAYVEYCFSSNVVLEQYTRLAMGSTLLALTIIKIKKILVAFPPLDEQRKIVQYLKLKCSSIDAAIKNKENLITKLVDYKKSLIYEVVTGKKEV